jgi:hypothetical protein
MWWLSGLKRISFGLAFVIVWMSAELDAYKTAQAFGQPQDRYFRGPIRAMFLLPCFCSYALGAAAFLLRTFLFV